MTREEDRRGLYQEQETGFLAAKIPLGRKKRVQHSFLTAQRIRTLCNQEPLSGPWRASVQYQVKFQWTLFLVTLLMGQITHTGQRRGLHLSFNTCVLCSRANDLTSLSLMFLS